VKLSGRSIPHDLPERPSSLYWKDFDEGDPRRKASMELSSLLAPQWLSFEVVRYLGELLAWETKRTYSNGNALGSDGATAAITHEEWQGVLTFLADLWDWWAEGVHLRPQLRYDEYTGQIQWDRSLAERLVPKCRPIAVSQTTGNIEPVRTTTLDSHLGDALFRLCGWLYWNLSTHPGEAHNRRRRCQGLLLERLAFRPTGTDGRYFGLLCARISAAGWRPHGTFPAGVFARGTDFDRDFHNSDLEDSSFRGAGISNTSFALARLAKADFADSDIGMSTFALARLEASNFAGARIRDSCFVMASLNGASFDNARVPEDFYGVPERPLGVAAPLCDFRGAEGMDLSFPFFSNVITGDAQTPNPFASRSKD
jgi:hypothetical protein